MKSKYSSPPSGHRYGAESIFVAIITCVLVSLMGVSLSKLHNASFQSLFSSEATMQAQHYAKTKMDYLVFNGYNNLAEQSKTIINDSEFKDTVILGTISTDANGISRRTVTVSVYRDNELHPRARLQQVFYSNDANKFVTNGSSATSSISMNYDKDNDRLYAMVDGEEKSLGGGSGVPIGTVIAWASNTNPTEGGVWLECNGQSCISYAKLCSVLGSNNVPDYRGVFLRGFGSVETNHFGNVVHNSGVLGELQGDAMVQLPKSSFYAGLGYIGRNFATEEQQNAFSCTGAFSYESTYNMSMKVGDSDNWGRKYIVDFSRAIPVANELRPVNIAVRYFIKAA